jgi:hypothetical protein
MACTKNSRTDEIMDTSFFTDQDGRVGSLGFLGKNLSRISVLYDFVGDMELGDLDGPRLRDNVTPGVGFIVGFFVGTPVGLTVNCSVIDVGGIWGWGTVNCSVGIDVGGFWGWGVG